MTVAKKTERAFAKINWFLHINGKRQDGYHELQTLFQLIDLHDTLTFDSQPSNQPNITVNCDLPNLNPQDNLVYKAAKLLEPYCHIPQHVSIHIEKRIPSGGGLGGGSSNAATTLVTLNRLWELGLDQAKLCQLGAKLGADVPVFVQGSTSAFAQGVGEQLTPVDLPAKPLILIIPPCHISTQAVFAHPELKRDTPKQSRQNLLSQPEYWQNDCETTVRKHYPRVALAMRQLSKFTKAQLSGTGACVFGAFDNKLDRDQALASLKKRQDIGRILPIMTLGDGKKSDLSE